MSFSYDGNFNEHFRVVIKYGAGIICRETLFRHGGDRLNEFEIRIVSTRNVIGDIAKSALLVFAVDFQPLLLQSQY